jgi:hypothetical protein
MDNKCAVCQQPFNDDKTLHRHLRTHKLIQSEYYQTYFPRYDRYDNSIIKYKNKEYYFNTEFNSKSNFVKWFHSIPIETAKQYVKIFLLNRKMTKSLIYAPSQVELRTLMVSGIKWIEKNFGNYRELCTQLGFINKFKQFNQFNNQIQLDKRRIIYIDSREKNLVQFNNVKSIIKKLDYGDYCFSDQDWSGNIFIERKSASDFIGTLSGDYERFEREITRAKEDNAYLIILVEERLDNLLNYKDLGYLNRNIRIAPEFVFHNVRVLIQKYPHIQFLFINSHKEIGEMIEKLFSIGEDIKQYDLQLLKDSDII